MLGEGWPVGCRAVFSQGQSPESQQTAVYRLQGTMHAKSSRLGRLPGSSQPPWEVGILVIVISILRKR